MKNKSMRALTAFLIVVLIAAFTACGSAPRGPAGTPPLESPAAIPTEAEPTLAPSPEPYTPMDIFGIEFDPYAETDFPDIFTVFAASFSKGSAKLEGRDPFVLSMTGSGNMFACIAYWSDVAGLGLDEGKKMELLEEYRANGCFCEFTGADGQIVTIRQADPQDDRYEYVEADGSHGFAGGGCVIDITCYVDDTDMEKYTQLVRDNYSMDALVAVADYFDVNTDFGECGIEVNLHKKEAKTSVTYYVPDTEAVRKSIAANIKSDWWEWYGNLETWISYDDNIGYKLTLNSGEGAITVEQSAKKLNGSGDAESLAEVSLTKLGFGFDESGTCGVYEEREPHYVSVAIHRPEWGDFDGDWNIEYMDNDVNGYSLRITCHEIEGRYHVSIEKGGVSCAYETYPEKEQVGWEYPDLETVHRMFNDAFGTEEKELYSVPLDNFGQFVQDRFGMSIQELYALPKQ